MVSVITEDMEYQIVTSKTLHGNDIGIINFPSLGEHGGLESLVRAEIEKGWMPLGGVIHGETDGEMVWIQAMVRHPKNSQVSMSQAGNYPRSSDLNCFPPIRSLQHNPMD